MPLTGPATYTVGELSERWKCKQHSVLAFISTGHLKAFSIGHKVGGRPRWRITAEAVAEFEQQRCARQPVKPTPRRGRTPRRTEPNVIRFY